MSTSMKLLIAGIVAVLAAAGVVAVLELGSGSGNAHSQVASSFHVGSSWKLTGGHSGPALAATSAGSKEADINTYDMKVISAPTHGNATWVVLEKLEGGEGPFADGYSLHYHQTSSDVLTLKSIAMGGKTAQPLHDVAPILGQGFPVQLQLSPSHPASSKVSFPGGALTGAAALPPPVALGSAESSGFAGKGSVKSLKTRKLVLPTPQKAKTTP